jgi:hypothetical protein
MSGVLVCIDCEWNIIPSMERQRPKGGGNGKVAVITLGKPWFDEDDSPHPLEACLVHLAAYMTFPSLLNGPSPSSTPCGQISSRCMKAFPFPLLETHVIKQMLKKWSKASGLGEKALATASHHRLARALWRAPRWSAPLASLCQQWQQIDHPVGQNLPLSRPPRESCHRYN